jgi:hypothetical protein
MMGEWKEMVDATVPQLEVQIGRYAHYNLVRIHKRPGSPATLPLISARTLMERRNEQRTIRWQIPKDGQA